MSGLTVTLELDRVDYVYAAGEKVSGSALLAASRSVSHTGVAVEVRGTVELIPSSRAPSASGGFFDAFGPGGSLKPVELFRKSIELLPPGKIAMGNQKIPFEFSLNPTFEDRKLLETYHGVYINVHYYAEILIPGGILSSDVSSSLEFIVHTPLTRVPDIKGFPIRLDSATVITGAHRAVKLPTFLIEGRFDKDVCQLKTPLTGEITIVKCDVPIRTIELQLLRVESITIGEATHRESTEIQNIQLADGDVIRGIPIPIFMILPRLFTCTTVATKEFKIDFEVNLMVSFAGDFTVTENFPLRLYR